MEIKTIKKLEKKALKYSSSDFLKLGFAIFFLIAVLIFSFLSNGGVPNNIFLAVAALIGAYMAMNIGANDVANNVGPAVGSRALTLTTAIIIAVIFETAGAFIAGGEVVKTIKDGIIDVSAFNGDPNPFIWAMMAALLSAALWLNIATAAKAPVSTTHAIVGGVMGAGIAAAGFSVVNWSTMGKIIISWIVSPVFGAITAILFLYAIKKSIIFKEDKVSAAKKYVPIFVSIMTLSFTVYIIMKGLNRIWPSIVNMLNTIPFISLEITNKPTIGVALIIGAILSILIYIIVKKRVSVSSTTLENTRKSVNNLFTIPLIFAAALLSFAHGANDVANAIGPLAAINDAIVNGGVSSDASIPFWVMGVGAFGISIGLALYGPKLIKSVGSEITELDQIRAFAIAMSASVTVIIASQLGLPVSSTHIAIGGVFGVGFLREWMHVTDKDKSLIDKELTAIKDEKENESIHRHELKSLESKDEKTEDDLKQIKNLKKLIENEKKLIKTTKKNVKKIQKIQYVKRDAIKKIVAAWVITVPATSAIGGLLYYVIKGIMS